MAAAEGRPEATAAPQVEGEAVYGQRLVATRGSWVDGADLAFTFQWLRGGAPIAGATGKAYRPTTDDLGRRLSVRVTATDTAGESTSRTSARTAGVRRAPLASRRAPRVLGTARYGHVLRATPGRWSSEPGRVRWTWYRGHGVEVGTGRRHRVEPGDVGRRLYVRAVATAAGHVPAAARSERTAIVRHRVDVSRSVTYHVTTHGHVTASVRRFARLAQQTYDDPRGWRAAGVHFRRVASGGDFTLVLAEASTMTDFSSECSVHWSCRVGRYVVINQRRWRHASPSWNKAGGTLRDYRNMVVDHETGHWLGLGHASCPGAGEPAPVMMQQSKDLGGCTFNPWPVASELATVAG
ncbi:DUF3152 domain-containing protein [Nocardioides sp. GY 10127]|uniref:DUF3152 domain-containing protein n=1 Tax=Nocardioides sp. GY 10127 TaxID=2569762 RepID=UPI001457EF70|nr:DUF3152 domain-containing protein [Nocardioides sp. GY 10127]